MFWPIQIMQSVQWHSAHADISYLPIFIPNDYLFETHKDKGKEKWEIYSWAIRDIIAKVGDLKFTEISLRDCHNHQRFKAGLKLIDSPEENQ